MSLVMAVCGKGGTGKTTLSALLIRSLMKKGMKPILAVDADPNANLAPALAIAVEQTVGQVLEEFHGQKLTIPEGMSKQAYLELRLNQAVAEAKGIDLLAMGRPEGPGCYCSANSVLRDMLERLTENYRYVVLDNEAGMEHLSRRTANRIDVLLMVTDPSMKGMRTVRGLLDLVAELKLPIVKKYLVVSRAVDLDPRLMEMVKDLEVPLLGMVPEDPQVKEFDLETRSFLELPDDCAAAQAAERMMEKLSAEWQ
ncbi:MAG TPA: AAA family ATPase [bacterium]|nr:AAA family ATPase [bacterium]